MASFWARLTGKAPITVKLAKTRSETSLTRSEISLNSTGSDISQYIKKENPEAGFFTRWNLTRKLKNAVKELARIALVPNTNTDTESRVIQFQNQLKLALVDRSISNSKTTITNEIQKYSKANALGLDDKFLALVSTELQGKWLDLHNEKAVRTLLRKDNLTLSNNLHFLLEISSPDNQRKTQDSFKLDKKLFVEYVRKENEGTAKIIFQRINKVFKNDLEKLPLAKRAQLALKLAKDCKDVVFFSDENYADLLKGFNAESDIDELLKQNRQVRYDNVAKIRYLVNDRSTIKLGYIAKEENGENNRYADILAPEYSGYLRSYGVKVVPAKKNDPSYLEYTRPVDASKHIYSLDHLAERVRADKKEQDLEVGQKIKRTLNTFTGKTDKSVTNNQSPATKHRKNLEDEFPERRKVNPAIKVLKTGLRKMKELVRKPTEAGSAAKYIAIASVLDKAKENNIKEPKFAKLDILKETIRGELEKYDVDTNDRVLLDKIREQIKENIIAVKDPKNKKSSDLTINKNIYRKTKGTPNLLADRISEIVQDVVRTYKVDQGLNQLEQEEILVDRRNLIELCNFWEKTYASNTQIKDELRRKYKPNNDDKKFNEEYLAELLTITCLEKGVDVENAYDDKLARVKDKISQVSQILAELAPELISLEEGKASDQLDRSMDYIVENIETMPTVELVQNILSKNIDLRIEIREEDRTMGECLEMIDAPYVVEYLEIDGDNITQDERHLALYEFLTNPDLQDKNISIDPNRVISLKQSMSRNGYRFDENDSKIIIRSMTTNSKHRVTFADFIDEANAKYCQHVAEKIIENMYPTLDKSSSEYKTRIAVIRKHIAEKNSIEIKKILDNVDSYVDEHKETLEELMKDYIVENVATKLINLMTAGIKHTEYTEEELEKLQTSVDILVNHLNQDKSSVMSILEDPQSYYNKHKKELSDLVGISSIGDMVDISVLEIDGPLEVVRPENTNPAMREEPAPVAASLAQEAALENPLAPKVAQVNEEQAVATKNQPEPAKNTKPQILSKEEQFELASKIVNKAIALRLGLKADKEDAIGNYKNPKKPGEMLNNYMNPVKYNELVLYVSPNLTNLTKETEDKLLNEAAVVIAHSSILEDTKTAKIGGNHKITTLGNLSDLNTKIRKAVDLAKSNLQVRELDGQKNAAERMVNEVFEQINQKHNTEENKTDLLALMLDLNLANLDQKYQDSFVSSIIENKLYKKASADKKTDIAKDLVAGCILSEVLSNIQGTIYDKSHLTPKKYESLQGMIAKQVDLASYNLDPKTYIQQAANRIKDKEIIIPSEKKFSALDNLSGKDHFPLTFAKGMDDKTIKSAVEEAMENLPSTKVDNVAAVMQVGVRENEV